MWNQENCASICKTDWTKYKVTSHFMHTKSATYSPENEASPSENEARTSLSRSLQDFSDIGQFSTSPTDLDAPASTSSQDNFLQVPAMTTNAVMTTTSHNSWARPKSIATTQQLKEFTIMPVI